MNDSKLRLALYQPDIPQNTGTILRLAACMDVPVEIIEPTGFAMTQKALRRAGMDYLDLARINTHRSFAHFLDSPLIASSRLVLLSTKADLNYTDFVYHQDDILLLGRESAGVPEHVHQRADARITIPMRAGMRSLNIAVAAAMVLGEALRRTDGFPNS